MKQFIATLESRSPYAQGRYHNTPKKDRELHEAYEERCVRFKLHTAVNQIFIPPIAFKLCLEATSQYLGEQIPGKGKERYTKHYRQGVICSEPVMLGLTPDDVRIERIFTEAQPGSAKGGRVWKWFPVIDHWQGELIIHAIDDIFTRDIVERHLKVGGMINGVGVWRPQNGGMWGKFAVLALREEGFEL